MITALKIIEEYTSFFEKRGHKKIDNSALVPANDPSTLFTSSGMQALIPYLLGKSHPQGNKLVNVQDCFRAQDIEEVGDNRHTTFFRMLGNWSLGDYFKKEQLPWFFEFLTQNLKLPANKLYVTVFKGYQQIPEDKDSFNIWETIFKKNGLDPKKRIFYYGPEKNWWSRSGTPQQMPEAEPGGPDSEVFYEFTDIKHDLKYGPACHPNCDCGKFMEIGNSVFMQFKKQSGEFCLLPQQNVDFGGGLERLLAASADQADVFKTNLFYPIVKKIEQLLNIDYSNNARSIRIVIDHLISSCFIINASVVPSNKQQGYVLRRFIRRGLDNYYLLKGNDITPILETIVQQYQDTNQSLKDNFEKIKNTILTEEEKYKSSRHNAFSFIKKRYHLQGDELMGKIEITSNDAFILYSTHGLSPTQIRSLGIIFNEKEFAEKVKEHQLLSRESTKKKLN